MLIALVVLLRIMFYISCGIVAIGFAAVVFGLILQYAKKIILPLVEDMTENKEDDNG